MGLDMDLQKAKKLKNASLQDIIFVDAYFRWRKNTFAKEYSLGEWCGIDEKDVNKDIVALYENECSEKYYCWDEEKQYPYNGIITSLVSWRKANQIHNWFVENVQNGKDDCGTYEVSKEQLETLLDICKNVFEYSILVDGKIKNGEILIDGVWLNNYEDGKLIKDTSYAKKHLPTLSGYFFGSVEYNQWYLNDVEDTINKLTNVLKNTDFENEIVFYSSSW